MNERIRELAEQAGMNIVDDKFSTYGKFAEKFAELIVQECLDIVRNSSLPDSYSEACLEYIADELEEHFGVDK